MFRWDRGFAKWWISCTFRDVPRRLVLAMSSPADHISAPCGCALRILKTRFDSSTSLITGADPSRLAAHKLSTFVLLPSLAEDNVAPLMTSKRRKSRCEQSNAFRNHRETSTKTRLKRLVEKRFFSSNDVFSPGKLGWRRKHALMSSGGTLS